MVKKFPPEAILYCYKYPRGKFHNTYTRLKASWNSPLTHSLPFVYPSSYLYLLSSFLPISDQKNDTYQPCYLLYYLTITVLKLWKVNYINKNIISKYSMLLFFPWNIKSLMWYWLNWYILHKNDYLPVVTEWYINWLSLLKIHSTVLIINKLSAKFPKILKFSWCTFDTNFSTSLSCKKQFAKHLVSTF
jgi:hypothetical protein